MAFADQEIFLRHSVAYQLFSNVLPYTKPAYTAAVERTQARLAVLDKVLLDRTYIVGERITLADVSLVTALTFAFSGHIHAELRKQTPNVVRYFETIVNHPKLAPIFDNGKPTLAEAAPTYQAPQKEQKEQKPKEAKPAQPKAEKKPKAKEVEEDDDIDFAPVEKKEKNPLDDLPKSAFNLEEWKRQYSNLDTPDALKWFYEK
jgi:elongation factor 1-gamma